MPVPVVFLGTPEFAAPTLDALHADPDIDVRLVITQPDRPTGRRKTPVPPPVKRAAEALGLPVFQPERVNHPDSIGRIAAETPACGVLVAYGEFLGRRLLQIPESGFVNLHPSLLPRYRGASPVQAAILNGDAETGISIIRMTRELDAGPVLHQRVVPLSGSETSGMLADTLARAGADEMPSVIRRWVAGEIDPTPQDDSMATYTRKLQKSDGEIDWSASAHEIERLVRAMSPWPRAWTEFRGQQLTIIAARLAEDSHCLKPGELILERGAVLVATGTGLLEILELQPAGKRAMAATDWGRGARLDAGARLSAPTS